MLTTMPKVDLSQLSAGARLRIDTRVPASDPLWGDGGPALTDGLEVHLEARRSGEDVLVRGTIGGAVDLACRRCLVALRVEFEEPVSLLYRPAGEGGMDEDETYVLPERGLELDLGPALREHALLAVPEFEVCREACAGLCPKCGADLNQARCGCETEETDERWAALRRLRPDG